MKATNVNARIFRRLRELGWADEIAKTATLDHLCSHKLIDKKQRLTEEGKGASAVIVNYC